jgi:hypothetical protein
MANEFEIINNPTSTPEAVSTGYQRQNTRAAAVSNGIDNSFVEVTDQAASEITVQISGGVDVSGTMYAAKTPAVFTVSSTGRYYLYLADGEDSTKKTVAIGTDSGDFDPELNARYLTSGERVLNWLIVKEGQGSQKVTVLKMTDVGRANGHNEPMLLMRTVISSGGTSTFTAPRSQIYTFELQAKGGDGGMGLEEIGSTENYRYPSGGGGGGYSRVAQYLKKGQVVTLTRTTSNGANNTLTALDGFETITSQNGHSGSRFPVGTIEIPAGGAGGAGATVNGQRGAYGANGNDGHGGFGGNSFMGHGNKNNPGSSLDVLFLNPSILDVNGSVYGGGGAGGSGGDYPFGLTAGAGGAGLLQIWG